MDGATQYATDVLDGRIIACRSMIDTCRRHMDDLEKRNGEDILWMPERADDVIQFFREVCTVKDLDVGHAIPLELMPWQMFLIQSLFGWVVKDDRRTKRKPGTRRFRDVFLCSAKAAGKSAMLAALDLYLISRDHYIDMKTGEKKFITGQKIIVSASKKEQAAQLGIEVSVEMVKCSEILSEGIGIQGGNSPYALYCPSRNSKLEAITNRSGSTGVTGLLLHGIHQEEFSDQHNRERWDALRKGLKVSPQPITMIATNPAETLSGLAYEHYQVAKDAAKGVRKYDHVLPMIYETDEDEIPESIVNVKRWYPIKKNWVKSNPSFPHGVPQEYYINKAISDSVTPAQKRETLRLNFGVWAEQNNEFIGRDEVVACEVESIDESDMEGKLLWLGLDLATTDDLTALAMLWGEPDDCYLKVEAYTGLANIKARTQESSGDMVSWVEQGFIKGNKSRTLDFGIVAKRIRQLSEDHDLQAVCLDVHRRGDWDRTMDSLDIPYRYETDPEWGAEEGILFVPHPQNHGKMPTNLLMDTSMTALEEAVYSQSVKIERNPVFQWAINSARVRHNDQMERRITKKDAKNHSRGKVDVLIASIEAFGLMRRGMVEPDMGKSIYNPWSDPDFNINDYMPQ